MAETDISSIGVEKRFKRYVGFVSPPGSFDFSPQQFVELCADRVGVIQNLPKLDGYPFRSDMGDGAQRLEMLRDGVGALQAAGADIVAQVGGYWALAYTPDADTAFDLEERLADEFGIRVVLVWNAVVEALRHFGARKVAVTTGYYRPEWSRCTLAFLESAGFEAVWWGDLIEQGLLPNQAAKEAVEAATNWDYPDDLVRRTCVEAARLAPACDAVCQTGAGMRVGYVAEAVERETGKPLVATDIALDWAILRESGLKAKAGFGSLLGSA